MNSCKSGTTTTRQLEGCSPPIILPIPIKSLRDFPPDARDLQSYAKSTGFVIPLKIIMSPFLSFPSFGILCDDQDYKSFKTFVILIKVKFRNFTFSKIL